MVAGGLNTKSDLMIATESFLSRKGVLMAKEELIEFEGTVVDVMPNQKYMVELENGMRVQAYTSGKMRRFRIRVVNGDKVTLELSPYDLTKGRISFRHKH